MARSMLVLLAVIGVTNALKIGKFESISSDKGVSDEWAKDNSLNVTGEDFNMGFASDKVYLVIHRNGTVFPGGIMSTLVNGVWKHAKFDELAKEQLREHLFTLSGRLFLMAIKDDGKVIEFRKLFSWDDDSSKWIEVKLDIPDARVSQELTRGPHNFVSINVPDHEGKIAYIAATDHEMTSNDSETSFSKLEVAFDSNKPVNASLKFLTRQTLGTGKAVIATTLKDNRLLAIVGNFRENASAVNLTIDYAIDLANNNTKVEDVKVDNSTSPMAYVDYAAGKRIIRVAKDLIIFLGPHEIKGDRAVRRVWSLNLASMKLEMTEADFLLLPNRIFVGDMKNMRLLTAGLMKGAYAAKIDRSA